VAQQDFLPPDSFKSGFDRFNFGKITENRMPEYITAVQASAEKNYEPMYSFSGF